MIESVSTITVRYAETDMMGIVYHASYLPWLEIGRTNLLKEKGLPYKELEAQNLLLPVLEISLRYLKPAHYDDSLSITTRMQEKPLVKIRLEYEIHRDEELLAKGHTLHAFMNKQGQPVRTPKHFLEAMDLEFGPES